jgi:dolichyl-phosphate-mannose-protein mannosyltransferase
MKKLLITKTLLQIRHSCNPASAIGGGRATLVAFLSQRPTPIRLLEPLRPGPRWLAATLVVLLAAHAALLVPWLAKLVGGPDTHLLPNDEFWTATGGAFAATMLTLVAFPRAPARALTLLVLTAACMFAGLGPVAVIAVMALSAYVVGSALLGRFARAPGAEAELPGVAVRMLVGSCLWIGSIAATLPFPVHSSPVYVVLLAASLAAFPRTTRDCLAGIARWARREEKTTAAERVCFALAAIVAIVHVIVVAKPEVGYDAGTMHLQFAQLVAHAHRWPFDVTRYAWAVMPMGADDAYLAAFLIAGERGARLQNLLFGVLLCATLYGFLRLQASRVVALPSVVLLASTPLWFLESGTLYVEFAWTAFLVAALLATIRFARCREPAWFAAAVLCCAGAMTCKVIGIFLVAPIVLALLWLAARGELRLFGLLTIVALAACVIGSWPYVNAWARTGNPVFPFMNDVFRSPFFPASAFNNPLYNAPLSLAAPYDLVLNSGRHIEGHDGAMGVQWLLLFPLVACGLVFGANRRLRAMLFALALAFGIAVYAQQSYLRYLMPAFVLIAILAGWSLADCIRSPRAQFAFVGCACAIALVNVSLMPTASWTNETLCVRCTIDAAERNTYIATHAPLRGVSDWLNGHLPDARVGFFVVNGPAPDGYTGYSRAANWHDPQLFHSLANVHTADDVAAIVRRFDLTHAVFPERSNDPIDRPLLAYRDRDTTTIARIGGYVVTQIRRRDGTDEASSASIKQ